MDTQTALDEAAPTAVNTTEPLDEAPSAPGKIYHFNLYGRASRGDLAAFAATRALLDSAVLTGRRESYRRTPGTGPEAGAVRHYVARFLTGGRADTRAVDRKFDTALPPRRSVLHYNRQRDERADIETVQRTFVITVLLGAKRGDNMLAAASSEISLSRGTFNFTVVNASVIQCVRSSSGRP